MPAVIHGSADAVWRLLTIFNGFRLTWAACLILLSGSGLDPLAPGRGDTRALLLLGIAYLIISITAATLIRRRYPGMFTQAYVQFGTDTLVVLILVNLVGAESGFGALLLMPVVGGALVLQRQQAYVFAGLATLGVVALHFRLVFNGAANPSDYTRVATLGVVFFITAIVGRYLTLRLQESEARAREAGIDLANFAALNEHVVQTIDTGVLVIDADERIRLMNRSGGRLLGYRASGLGTRLRLVSRELGERLSLWQLFPDDNPTSFELAGRNIVPRFQRLGPSKRAGTLIYIEDEEAANQRVQQLKLAALGRLTASIAHEIRNPLAAISHANQLLAESPQIPRDDHRLLDIINHHTRRVNTIVENVLQLSKRDRSHPELLNLTNWLAQFLHEFLQNHGTLDEQIRMELPEQAPAIRCDPSHLEQVLNNLCENALEHAGNETEAPLVTLRLQSASTSRLTLDVVDNGPGIDRELSERIFEPFYTSHSQGTGLGLYIAQELCRVNAVSLSYLPGSGGGSCFRLTFSCVTHPDIGFQSA